MERELPEARCYRPVQVLDQLRRSLGRELDLAVEARSTERFARNFADDADIVIPKVFWAWTSGVMNVQEESSASVATISRRSSSRTRPCGSCCAGGGRRAQDDPCGRVLPCRSSPGERHVSPRQPHRADRLWHGGTLSPARRNQIVDLLAGLANHDDEAMLEVLLDWRGSETVDEPRLAADLGELAFDFADVPLRDLRLGVLLHRVSAILREHSIVLPADLTLLFKALITLEGLGRQYDPEFQLIERAKRFLDRAAWERYQPAEVVRRGRLTIGDFVGLITSLPRDIARLVKDARQGRIKVDLDLKRLDSFGDRLDRAIDRVTIGVMTASLVIGSSIVMTVPGGPTVFGLSLLTIFGLVGYLIAFVNSLWVIFSIWRSGRR